MIPSPYLLVDSSFFRANLSNNSGISSSQKSVDFFVLRAKVRQKAMCPYVNLAPLCALSKVNASDLFLALKGFWCLFCRLEDDNTTEMSQL